jgi:molecular chaperone GrpE (heat shock protein)
MVLKKLRQAFSGGVDDKYEVLYHKYSQIKSENNALKKKHTQDMHSHKIGVQTEVAKHLIKVYEAIESSKESSFKIHATSKELQQMMMDINTSEKAIKNVMKEFSLEEVEPKERYYDPEIHEVATYNDAKGMAKGLIIKTVKKGFRFRGDIIKKPRVVVTK